MSSSASGSTWSLAQCQDSLCQQKEQPRQLNSRAADTSKPSSDKLDQKQPAIQAAAQAAAHSDMQTCRTPTKVHSNMCCRVVERMVAAAPSWLLWSSRATDEPARVMQQLYRTDTAAPALSPADLSKGALNILTPGATSCTRSSTDDAAPRDVRSHLFSTPPRPLLAAAAAEQAQLPDHMQHRPSAWPLTCHHHKVAALQPVAIADGCSASVCLGRLVQGLAQWLRWKGLWHQEAALLSATASIFS